MLIVSKENFSPGKMSLHICGCPAGRPEFGPYFRQDRQEELG